MFYSFRNSKIVRLRTAWDSPCGNKNDEWKITVEVTNSDLDKRSFVFDADLLKNFMTELAAPKGQGFWGSCEQIAEGFAAYFQAAFENALGSYAEFEAKLTMALETDGENEKAATIRFDSYDKLQPMRYGPLRRPAGVAAGTQSPTFGDLDIVQKSKAAEAAAIVRSLPPYEPSSSKC